MVVPRCAGSIADSGGPGLYVVLTQHPNMVGLTVAARRHDIDEGTVQRVLHGGSIRTVGVGPGVRGLHAIQFKGTSPPNRVYACGQSSLVTCIFRREYLEVVAAILRGNERNDAGPAVRPRSG